MHCATLVSLRVAGLAFKIGGAELTLFDSTFETLIFQLISFLNQSVRVILALLADIFVIAKLAGLDRTFDTGVFFFIGEFILVRTLLTNKVILTVLAAVDFTVHTFALIPAGDVPGSFFLVPADGAFIVLVAEFTVAGACNITAEAFGSLFVGSVGDAFNVLADGADVLGLAKGALVDFTGNAPFVFAFQALGTVGAGDVGVSSFVRKTGGAKVLLGAVLAELDLAGEALVLLLVCFVPFYFAFSTFVLLVAVGAVLDIAPHTGLH